MFIRFTGIAHVWSRGSRPTSSLTSAASGHDSQSGARRIPSEFTVIASTILAVAPILAAYVPTFAAVPFEAAPPLASHRSSAPEPHSFAATLRSVAPKANLSSSSAPAPAAAAETTVASPQRTLVPTQRTVWHQEDVEFENPMTLLDEVGKLRYAVPSQMVAAWKAAFAHGNVPQEHAAWMHVWLGEWEIAANEDPQAAAWHFQMAQKVAPGGRANSVYGLAAYDAALTLRLSGAYRDSMDALLGLLGPDNGDLTGFDRGTAALLLRHVAACVGYHKQNSDLGVPEPPRLDPLCGVASMAVVLKAHGIPYDLSSVRRATRVTGIGSRMTDLLAACPKLGMVGRVVKVDEQGLRHLPLPVVAYVEEDHFVAVTEADATHICFTCSDCGPWPGGNIRLTWSQFRRMKPGFYLTMVRPGSVEDRQLAQALSLAKMVGLYGTARTDVGAVLAATAPLSQVASSSGHAPFAATLVLARHITALSAAVIGGTGCSNYVGGSQSCPSQTQCPTTCRKGGSGPDGADPVNLATGQEEYMPDPDIVVYNPHGPSVVWSRISDSLRPPNTMTSAIALSNSTDYQNNDFGLSWTQSYNYVVDSSSGASVNQFIVAGNGNFAMASIVAGLTFSYSGTAQSGLTWDVEQSNGTTVATSSSPNGWSVYGPGGNFMQVSAPSSATAGTGYVAHFYGPPYYTSMPITSTFDVVAAATAPRGVPTWLVSASSSTAPTYAWEIWYNGTEIANSSSPHGWYGSGGIGAGSYADVYAPVTATIGSGYTYLVGSGSGPFAVSFSVGADRFIANNGSAGGQSFLTMPNGARITFTAPSVPTSSNPNVVCSVAPNQDADFALTWNYDGSSMGHYTITWRDGTSFITTGCLQSIPMSAPGYTNSALFFISQVVDRVGNTLDLNYTTSAQLPPCGTPLLTSFVDASTGNMLLTINRNGDSQNDSIASVSDANGRSVYYTETPYNLTYVSGTSYVVSQVSQAVATGTNNPAFRWQYTYVTSMQRPALSTITVPSATGSGNATAYIYYAPDTAGGNPNTNFFLPLAMIVPTKAEPADRDNWVSKQPEMVAMASYPSSLGTQQVYAGMVTSYVDANGVATFFSSIDANHMRTVVTDSAGNIYSDKITGWDNNMSRTTTTDNAGNVTWTMTCSDPANIYKATSYTDATGHTTNLTWDSHGNTSSVTTPRLTTTNYTWNYTSTTFPFGRLTQAQQGSKTPITAAYFEPSGLLKSLTFASPTGTGTVSHSFTYSALGNLLTDTGPGNPNTNAITTTFGYTSDTNSGDENFSGNGSFSQDERLGEPLTVANSVGKVWHHRYDSLGHTVASWDPSGYEYDNTYDSGDDLLTTALPATGQQGSGRGSLQNVYLYPNGPRIEQQLFDESGSGTAFRAATYSYDPEGNLLAVSGNVAEPYSATYDALYRQVTVTDAASHTTTWTYNPAGYLASVTYPGGDSLSYPSYDANGRVLKRIDGNGVETDYNYTTNGDGSTDPDGSLATVKYPTTPALNAAFYYDAYRRITSLTDGTGSRSYTYNNLDQQVSTTTTYTGVPAQTVSYGFYADGSRSSLTTPAGTFSYVSDPDGRPENVTNPFGEKTVWQWLVNDWPNSQTNNQTAFSFANGYNALGEVTALTDGIPGNYTYDIRNTTFDGAGNRVSAASTNFLQETALSGSVTYGYDSSNRLTGEDSTRGSSYGDSYDWANAFDNAGNLTTLRGVSGFTYNADNQLSGGTGLGTFAYDGNGNSTTYNGTGITFDVNNNPTSFGSLITAGYGIDGLRAWKQDSATGNRTYFIYDGMHPVVEINSAGTILATNTFGPDGLSSRNTTATGAAAGVGTQGTVYYEFDDRGNTIARFGASSSTTPLNYHLYDAWGGTMSPRPGDPQPSTVDPWDGPGAQYGGYTDHETGVTLDGFRYYDPSRGRWINRDPIGMDGGLNLYAVDHNNPVTNIDQYGLYGLTNGGGPFDGIDTKDPEGYPVTIGGPQGWFLWGHLGTGDSYAMTYSGTVHFKDMATYDEYLNQECWRIHEHWHTFQEQALWFLYLPTVGSGYVTGFFKAIWDEVMGVGGGKGFVTLLHDENWLEEDADEAAYHADPCKCL
jgi:RHS repeat-associated protein